MEIASPAGVWSIARGPVRLATVRPVDYLTTVLPFLAHRFVLHHVEKCVVMVDPTTAFTQIRNARLVSIIGLLSIGLWLAACQGAILPPDVTVTTEPTTEPSPSPTHTPTRTAPPTTPAVTAMAEPSLSPTHISPTPDPVTTAKGVETVASMACLVADLPAKGPTLWSLKQTAWSPEGDVLAYIGPSDAMTAPLMLASPPYFEQPRNLAMDARGDPTWSPDGTQVAYVAFRSDDQVGTVVAVAVDSATARDLLPGELAHTDTGAGFKAIDAWLDQQNILVFTNCGTGCRYPHQLDTEASTLVPLFSYESSFEYFGSMYAWSPDRRYVAITSGARPQIGFVSIAEGEKLWLSSFDTLFPERAQSWSYFVDWAFDSSRFLFLLRPIDASTLPELWVWDVESGTDAFLLPDVMNARWSPDGKLIAWYALGAGAVGESANGTYAVGLGLYDVAHDEILAFTHIGEVAGEDQDPYRLQTKLHPLVWSPDGTRLAYTDSVGAVYILSPDTLSRYRLDVAVGASSLNALAWSPSGEYLAVNTLDRLQVFQVPCMP